jgi:hypothetical protein
MGGYGFMKKRDARNGENGIKINGLFQKKTIF